jgi:hypothetical protein
MEMLRTNEAIQEALGEPIEEPWRVKVCKFRYENSNFKLDPTKFMPCWITIQHLWTQRESKSQVLWILQYEIGKRFGD